MARVLRFVLEAPLASWGVGGATIRPSEMVPTHSAIVGLLASALGWGRDDERQAQLAESYARAVRTDRTGRRVTDYHTVQTPHRPAIKVAPRTRAEELSAVEASTGRPHTSITQREYLQDVRYTVVLWPLRGDPPRTPEELADALKRPMHALYAGRRSCPLSAPVAPEVLSAESLDEVLSGDAITWDSSIPHGKLQAHHVLIGRDQLLSPVRRAFGARQDHVS
jgi:CRISPR system Cascade subunit CasD